MKNLLLTALVLMAISANAQENVTIHNGNQSYSTTVEYITFDDVDEDNLINVNALKSANENLSGQIEQISEGLENLEDQVEALKNQPTTIADDAITSAKIKNGEVKTDDIADGAVAPSKLNTTNTAESGKILSCNNGNFTWIDASNIYVNPKEIALGIGKIFIGNQDGYAKEKPLTGDANISTEGVLTIGENAITSAKIKDGTIKAADIANNTITFGKLSLLSDAQIIIGNNNFGNTAINLSGDATMDNSGKVTIANDAITSEKIKDGEVKTADIADGAITTLKLSTDEEAEEDDVLSVDQNGNLKWVRAAEMNTSFALESSKIFVGNADDKAEAMSMSGDVTINYRGETTIGDGKVITAKLADNAVTTAKLAEGSVTTTEILNETILAEDIADEAITSAKIKDGTIKAADIANDAITSDKIKDGTIQNDDLNKTNIPLSGFAKANEDIDCGGHKLINVATPTADNDAANKAYVDGLKSRISQLETDIANLTNILNELTEAMAKTVQTE